MVAALSSVPDLFEVLGRNPSDVIGVPESDWLDFKGSPYYLDNERQRWELAKDVSAVANTLAQGVIVLGVETELEPSTRQEIAKALQPIADEHVDPKRIMDVIHEWVHPRLDVNVKPHPVQGQAGHLWTILVEAQSERDLPFIVKREFRDERGSDRNVFGVYKRSSAYNAAYPPAQVHQWLHAGWIPEPEPTTPIAPGEELEQVAARVLQDDLQSCGLLDDDYAYYYLQASPTTSATLSRFYEGRADSLFEVLTDPPHVRPLGFGFRIGQRPERTAYDGLRVFQPISASLSTTRSGLLTGILGQRYLTWGSEKYSPEGQTWINPIALVETTLEFWRFYLRQVLARGERRAPSVWRVGMKGLGPAIRVMLPRFLLGKRASSLRKPQGGQDFETLWRPVEHNDAGSQAFVSLTEVYARFGYDSQVIPLAENESVSEAEILRIK